MIVHIFAGFQEINIKRCKNNIYGMHLLSVFYECTHGLNAQCTYQNKKTIRMLRPIIVV